MNMPMPSHRLNVTSAQQRALKLLARLKNATGGSAGAEFGIIAPGLVLLMICTVDLGLGIYRKTQVQNAAQAGAAYAAARGFTEVSVAAAITQATNFPVEANPAPAQFCGCPSSSGIAPAACDTPCADGMAPGTYVTASAKAIYTPLIPYPALPSSFELTSRATVRIQ